MVGNAVWAEGSGTEQSPYTGEITNTIPVSENGTVYLKDAIINVSNGYALDLSTVTNFTLNVSGTCELKGANDIALNIPGGNQGGEHNFTIDGDGLVRIYGLQGTHNDKIGSIYVKGGTVYFLGDIGHDNGQNSGTINVQGGIAFVNGAIKGKADHTDGILFERTTPNTGTWNGTLYQDYIIESNIQADIDGDGEANDDPINLNLNNFDLSLGEGVVIDNRTGNFTVTGNGTFTCFTVTYNENKVNAQDEVSDVPTNPSFYGPKADIRLEDGITCNGNPTSGKHAFLGWVKEGETTIHSASTGSIKTNDTYNGTGTQPININAAWATAERVVNLVEGEEISPVVELADKPEGAVSYASLSTGLPSGISFNNTTATFTGTVGDNAAEGGTDGKYEVTIQYTYTKDGSETSGTTKVTFNVADYVPNISTATVTITVPNEDLVYNGSIRNQFAVIIDGKEYNARLFKTTYTYTPEEAGTTSYDENSSIIVVKNAGTYTITKIEAASTSVTGTLENPKTADNQTPTIKVKPIDLTFTPVPQNIDIDESFGTPVASYYDATFNLNGNMQLTSGSIVTGEVTSTSYDILSGNLSTSATTIGTHADGINASGVSLKSAGTFLTNNYDATFNSGSLTIYDALDDDDVKTEIENGDGEGDEEDKPSYNDETNTWTLTYDGKTHEITKVKKGETVIPAQTDGKDNYTISYTYKATEEGEATDLEEGDEVKNAGIYTATIEFTNGYSGTKTETIIIKPRDLTVDLNIPETIDPEQDLSDLSNWWTKDKIELTGIVADEADEAKAKLNNASVSITGPLTSGEAIDVVVNNIKLEDNDPFLTSNYTITYKNGETTISTFETKDSTGENNDATLDDGTTVGQIEINPSEGGDDITGGEDNSDPKDDDLADEEDFVMIHPSGEGEISVYDGEPHGLSLLIIETENGTYKLKETEDYTVTYKNEEGEDLGTDVEPKHAGSYTAIVTLVDGSQYKIKDSDDNSFELTIQIKQRPLEVYLNVPTTIKENQNTEDLSSWWNSSKITFNEGGFANDTEKEAAVSTLSDAEASIEGTLPEVGQNVSVTLTNIELTDSDPFFTSNYTITYKKDNTAVEGITLSDEDNDNSDDDATIDDGTKVEESDKTELDPEGDDTIGGEDENNDGDLDETNDFILLSPDGDTYASVYDGDEHALTMLKFDNTTLNVGTDYTVSGYTSDDDPNVGENSLPKHAATYSATVTLTNDDYKWKDGGTSHTFNNITINKRPMYLTLRSGVTFRSAADVTLEALIEEQSMGVDEGLVNGEQPKYSGEPVVEQVSGTHWTATISREDFQVLNGDNFYVSDYDITLYNASSEGEDDGEELTDEGKLPDDGGDDIVVDIIVNPEIPFEPGGNHGSGWDKPEYYNIYIDTVCPGLNVEVSRDVVKGGNEVSVYLTIQSECDTTGMRFEYKRGLFGIWKDLKELEGVQPGGYIIKNIYTDIYIRALDATMPDDATGLEEVEGVKAYAQDGNIYVYTPNRMPVWIVSMTGAVLRNEEQVGLQAYDRLTRGIYIVRVGEQVFKIRL